MIGLREVFRQPTVDRKVSVKESDWTIVPRVTLLEEDSKITKIDFNLNKTQTHISTRLSDSRGERATLLVFNNRVTKATLVSKDGTQRELSSIDVKATEFTTPDSMPASLPANSAFTYCTDIKAVGIGDDEWVEFDSPVMMYVDNFLGFEVGEVVPVGYYDRVDGEWKCSDNGVVIQLLDISGNGKVDALDSTGDGQANDLNGNGSFEDEVEGIKDNPSYAVGNSYWRAAISHFTPWDHNWPWGPDGDGPPPPDPDSKPNNNPPPESCKIKINSFVDQKSQVFHEDIPLAGTSKTLHYASNRVDGYQYIISTTVDMTNSPASAINAEVRVEVAGRTLIEEATLGQKNSIKFKWDGKDALGNRVQGAVDAKVKAVYYYKLVYYSATDEFEKSWAKSGSRATDVIARDKIGLTSQNIISLTPQTPPQSSNLSNGWSISSHKEALDEAVITGSGDIIYPQESVVGMIRRVAGDSSGYNGDDINASDALLNTPTNMSIDTDGNIFFVDSKNYRVRKIDSNGVITAIIGDGNSASLNPKAVTLDDNKNIYIADGTTIKKIDIDGNSKTLIGGGSTLVPIDGGVLKNDAKLLTVISLAIDTNQDLYFIESDGSDSYLRKVDKCGLITTPKFKKQTPSTPTMDAPRSITIDNNNNLYISNNSLVYRVTKDNILSVVAGGGSAQIDDSSQKATDILLDSPQDLAVDSSGNLYIADSAKHSVYRVDSDGYIVTIAGVGVAGDSGDGWVGTQSKLNSPQGVVVDIDGNIYISDSLNHHIRKVDASSLFSKDANGNKIYINANNTAEVFDSSGRHLRQIDLATNKTLVSYGYDKESGYLSSISDEFNLTTTINRDQEGSVTTIVAPNGQINYLSKDENGNLTQIRYQDGSSYRFTYYEDNSLMDKMIDPNGNEISHIFNEEGHITKEIDGEGGEYRFAKSTNANTTTYTYTNPQGNSYISRDSITTDGNYLFEITLPSGDSYTKTLSANKNYKETTRNGVVSTQKYDIDPYTKAKHLSVATITQPSGLKSTKTFTRNYDRNATHTTKKTDTITDSSSNTSTVVTDYKNATVTITSPEGRVSSIAKDKTTLLPQTITVGTLTPTTYTYDDKGRVTKETTGERTTSYTYSNRGNIATITDPKEKTTSLSYDNRDRVVRVVYPNGTNENFTYDNNSNLLQRKVPTPANHNFQYNGVDSNTNYTSPLNKATTYTYNKNQKVTQITRPSGDTISNTYTKDRLVSTTTQGTTTYNYLYNKQLQSITKANESFNFSYDGTLLTQITQQGILNHTSTYTYNSNFQPISFTYTNQTYNYSYDKDGLLTQSGDFTITRDTNNGYTTQVTDNTITQDRSYNNYGEITELSDNIFTYELTNRDKNGAITQKVETLNGTTETFNYTYDTLGRLTKACRVGASHQGCEEYSYDNNHNRASATLNNQTTTASYTLDDQLEVYGDNTYRYNNDGYLQTKTTPEGTTTYSYGAMGELLEVITPTQTIIYLHNASNQRVAKLVDGTITEKYLWANLTTLLAIYDKDDTLIQRFNYADQRVPISMVSSGTKYYLHYDQVGTLRAVSNSSHTIVKEIDYDTFGNILSDSNPSVKVPFGFAGGLYDTDTQLTRFGYRDYDAFTGKWLAKDPIGFDGGDSNLYGYVLGDPVGLVDPSGLVFYNDTDNPIKIRPEDIKPNEKPTKIIQPHCIYWGGIDGFKPPFYDGDWHKVKDGTGVWLTSDNIWQLGLTSRWPNCNTRIKECESWQPGRKPYGFFPE